MRRAADDTVDGHVPALIIDSLARIDTDAIASLVADHDVAVIDAHHRLTIHVKPGRESFPPALKRALDVMTGTAEHADALLAGIEWGGGRPPLGCTSNGGRLAPDDDYDAVCWTLQQVADDRMSKTDAAEDLDCTRKTIDNALERRELYRIE
ncbi:resolvase [Halorubrum aidingense JCM 13560]|uniref:Resolvase n=2 Tax=Halorubrum aidingense TaxID=368623 RepID=M0PG44_9EURY|nr:resolvase [Halorubrum aidingense JCM 13560]